MKSFEFIPNRAAAVEKAVPARLCEQTVARIEQEFEFKPCRYNSQVDTNYRDCSEVKIRDKKLTRKFWSHIKKFVPPECDGEQLVGPHESRVYLLRYFEGQFFKKHYDGYSEDSRGNVSKLTVMIYLNDMDETAGGATRFYAEPYRNVYFAQPYQDYPVYDVVPRVGTMVMFTHKLLHEGSPIRKGYKYCIRFNILYTNTRSDTNTPSEQVDQQSQKDQKGKEEDNGDRDHMNISSSRAYDGPDDGQTDDTGPDDAAKQLESLSLKTNLDNFANVPYTDPIKYRRTTETRASPQKYRDMPASNRPASNGLKYTSTQMTLHNGTQVTLTPNRDNQASKDRWIEVSMRSHVFMIRKAQFPGFIDTTIGRPPTWEEDYCPNCYEILPLRNTYANCPGCCYPVVRIDAARRHFNLTLHRNGGKMQVSERTDMW